VKPPLDVLRIACGAARPSDVAVLCNRRGDRAEASLASSTRFIELDAFVWSNSTVHVLARNLLGGAFGPGAATLSVAVRKRRAPWACSRHTGRSSHRPRRIVDQP